MRLALRVVGSFLAAQRTAVVLSLLSIVSLFAPLGAVAQHTPSSVIVRLRPGVAVKEGAEALSAAVASVGGAATARAVAPAGRESALMSASRLDRYVVVELNGAGVGEALRALGGSAVVEEVFPNHRYRIAGGAEDSPNDSAFAEQWALRTVEAEEAWKITRGDSSVRVGIVDTGIDFDHPDLRDALAINRPEDANGNGRFDPWPSSDRIGGVTGDLDALDNDGNGFVDDVIGFDFIDQIVANKGDWSQRDGVPFDEQGHGTHVAGVVAAVPGNGIGIAGLAPGVRLVTLRTFDADGNADDDDIAAAIIYAADNGLDILNLSFGDVFRSPLMHDAIRYAYAKGVVVVASSGNVGGSGPHYPSDFPEAISVGMSGPGDYLDPLSKYGSQLSLIAPGVDIVTTAPGGAYKEVDGTSFSAPYVAATAALLRSIHPDWNPDEIRTAIELAADDVGEKGWDIHHGAGRLNARQAVTSPGPASVAILTPELDQGFAAGAVVAVRGSAMAPFLKSWQLMYGYGELPGAWIDLTPASPIGRVGENLGSLDLRTAPDTTIMLRLRLELTNGRITERRVRLYLDRTKPAVTSLAIENVWRFRERAVGVIVRTDDLTRATAWIRRKDARPAPYRAVSLEPERTGLMRNHYLILGAEEMDRGVPYDLYLELRNTSGDTALVGSADAPLEVVRERESFPPGTFARKSWTLPFGYTLNRTADFFGDGRRSVVLNRGEGGDFGKLMLYTFEGVGFAARDSVASIWLPRGIADTDGDGLREVLGQSRGTGVIFEQASPNGTPLATIAYKDTTSENFWVSDGYDFDGDGRDEIIARDDNDTDETGGAFYVARRNGSTLEKIATLPNTTSPRVRERRNFFGPPESAVADFDGDGLPEILFGDNDADFLIYERQADGEFERVWTNENDGEGGSEMVAAGDLDGDGRDEIIVGFRSAASQNLDGEYDPPFWTVNVYRLGDDGRDTLIWGERIAYLRPTNPFRSSVGAGDLDGKPGDELVINTFPSLYVLRWDAAARTLRPFWWREGSVNNEPIIADFDGDGVNEVSVGNLSTLAFYQIDPNYRGPEAPTGFQGWALNDSTVRLEWNPVAGAEFYTVYRGVRESGSGSDRVDSIAVTADPFLIDSGFVTARGALDPAVSYVYYVTTRDNDLPLTESPIGASGDVVAFTHEPARIDSATGATARAIDVRMSFYVREGLYRPGAFEVRNEEDDSLVPVSSVTYAGDYDLVVTLAEDLPGRALRIRPTSLFRDYAGTPADTTVAQRVVMSSEMPEENLFVATRASIGGANTIAIDFNAPVDAATVLLAANYALAPAGAILSVAIDPADPARVLLTLPADYPLGAYGVDYLVTITGVRSGDGRPINDGAGSVVGFTVNAPNLDAVFAYPQPFSITRDERVTFAGLTLGATVEVLGQTGRLIRRIRADEGNGGAAWDGTDESGERVATGIYLYRVTGAGPDGMGQSALRKIAVVR